MNRWLLAAALAGLTLLGYWQFPGHTYLQSDTQIYAPILEHRRDPGLFRREPIVEYPHVGLTVYDECALGIERLTGLDLERALAVPQLVSRALGLLGFYLMATAAGLAPGFALFVAACLGLGATVVGPSVLTFEYEPVPRGVAVPLVYLAIGLAAHKRWLWAGAAASAGVLFHAPSTYPFWGAYALLLGWPGPRRDRLRALLPLAGALLVLAAAADGGGQPLFRRVEPLEEKLQRLRASYVWAGVWAGAWMPHYAVLCGILAAALARLKAGFELRWFAIALPAIGMLSVPASWVLLEQAKWAFIPQFQPTRALLFVILMAGFAAAAAGCAAARARRYPEAALWFLITFAIPAGVRFTVFPRWRVLAAAAALAVVAAAGRPAALAVAAVAAAFAIPLAGIRNYPALDHTELRTLSTWARETTPAGAVFLFPDAARELYPGIFRARALRAVYVDWKAGGQVNYFRQFGYEWWNRWQAVMTSPPNFELYQKLGIDYVVMKRGHALAGRAPVFENARYAAYRVAAAR